VLSKDPLGGLIGYINALYNDYEDSKSTEAFIFFFAGSLVSWRSAKQRIVAYSSIAAEYIALDTVV
jgi:hypothetical protein